MNNDTSYQPLPPVPQTEVVQQAPQVVNTYQPLTPQQGGKKFKTLVIVLIMLFFVVLSILGVALYKRFASGSIGPVTLTYWGLWDDEAAITELIGDYESQNPSVKINYVKQSPTEYRERLTSSMARGEAPDIFRFHNTWTPMFYAELAPLPDSVIGASEYSETFYPAAIESLTTPNGIGGIPLMYDSLGLFINQDIFTTFSESVPSTWNEFRQTATDLTVRDSSTESIRQSGAALGRIDNVDYWQEIISLMLLQNGVTMSDPKGDLASSAFQYYLQFSVVDKVWDETLPDSTTAFSSGRQLAMFIAPSMVSEKLKSDNPNLRFRVYPVPQLPKYTSEDPDITYAVFWAEGVWAGGKHTEEAWKFLKFLSSQESLQKLHTSTDEPYPRRDMAGLLVNDQYYGATIKLAEDSRTWYAASALGDGETGLNTQLTNALTLVLENNTPGNSIEKGLEQLNFDIRTILSKYGLATPPPPPEE